MKRSDLARRRVEHLLHLRELPDVANRQTGGAGEARE